MKKTNWKDITEMVGLFAILASLIFLGYEMRQTKNIALGESEMASQAILFAELQLINSHPEIWVKGNSNTELSETEKAVFQNMVHATMNRIFFQWSALKRLEDEAGSEAWLNSFAGYLYRHPGARRVWQEHEATVNRERQMLDPLGNQEIGYVGSIQAKLEILDQMTESGIGSEN